jgi:hypothetical protein
MNYPTGEQAPRWQRERWPQLFEDASPVPPGLKPRTGVYIGCGNPKCRECYEPDDQPLTLLICPVCLEAHDDTNEDVLTCLGCSYDFANWP